MNPRRPAESAAAGATSEGDPFGADFARLAKQLTVRRSAALDGLADAAVDALPELGIRVAGGRAQLDDDVELLSAAAVRSALTAASRDWLRQLDIRPCIDSTNTSLLAAGALGSIDGCVLSAEVQTAGRGRRGRTWLSPFARNLALSIGFASRRPVGEIGSLSLITGLAVRQALLEHGLADVELKWPNDVLLQGRKLAGILIELVRATPPVEVVIGIGVNVGGASTVAERVEQAVADVAEQIVAPSRNALLAGIVNHLLAFGREWEAGGFEPLRQRWQAAHRYQGAAVALASPATGEVVSGTVLGVANDGALRLLTAAGVREFNSGEVTLRAA